MTYRTDKPKTWLKYLNDAALSGYCSGLATRYGVKCQPSLGAGFATDGEVLFRPKIEGLVDEVTFDGMCASAHHEIAHIVLKTPQTLGPWLESEFPEWYRSHAHGITNALIDIADETLMETFDVMRGRKRVGFLFQRGKSRAWDRQNGTNGYLGKIVNPGDKEHATRALMLCLIFSVRTGTARQPNSRKFGYRAIIIGKKRWGTTPEGVALQRLGEFGMSYDDRTALWKKARTIAMQCREHKYMEPLGNKPNPPVMNDFRRTKAQWDAFKKRVKKMVKLLESYGLAPDKPDPSQHQGPQGQQGGGAGQEQGDPAGESSGQGSPQQGGSPGGSGNPMGDPDPNMDPNGMAPVPGDDPTQGHDPAQGEIGRGTIQGEDAGRGIEESDSGGRVETLKDKHGRRVNQHGFGSNQPPTLVSGQTGDGGGGPGLSNIYNEGANSRKIDDPNLFYGRRPEPLF